MLSNVVYTGPGLKNSWKRLEKYKSGLSISELRLHESLQTKNNKVEIRTCETSSTILSEYAGETFHVYNGYKFIPVFIKKEMVGYKLGSFVSTRNTNKVIKRTLQS